HIRLELAPKKELALEAEPPSAVLKQAPPQAPPPVPKRTRASTPAKVETPAAVSKVGRQTRRRTASAALDAAKPKAAAHEAASKDGAPHRKASSPVVIVDVSNVAREECDEQGRAKLENFLHLL